MTHRELQQQCTDLNTALPCTEAHLQQLIRAMPTPWTDTIQAATTIATPLNLAETLHCLPPYQHSWYQHGDRAGNPDPSDPTTILLDHTINPIGILTKLSPEYHTSNPTTTCTQIHAWAQTQIAHNEKQREARERAIARGEPDPFPLTWMTSGAVVNTNVMPIRCNIPPGANPSHMQLTYRPTDTVKQPTVCSCADVNHIYLSHLRSFFKPLRTLDPDHTRTTATSTTYVPLLTQPNTPPAKIRQAIISANTGSDLPPTFRQTQYMVLCDAFHIAHACVKKTCTKGICDLCYVCLNRRVPETLHHILCGCPFSKGITTAIWRTIFAKQTQPHTLRTLLNLNADEFLRKFRLRILFGVSSFEDDDTESAPSRPAVAFAAATNTYLLSRRHRNAHGPGPLDTDTPKAIRTILQDVASIATAQRTLAERDETYIYTHYEGWLPETLPTEEWWGEWQSLILDTKPRATTRFKPSDSQGQLVGSCPDPTYDPNHPDTKTRFNSIRPNVRY